MSTEPTRYFFVHLQKTAGTSFSRQMKDAFGRPAIYPSDEDGDPIARVSSTSTTCSPAGAPAATRSGW